MWFYKVPYFHISLIQFHFTQDMLLRGAGFNKNPAKPPLWWAKRTRQTRTNRRARKARREATKGREGSRRGLMVSNQRADRTGLQVLSKRRYSRPWDARNGWQMQSLVENEEDFLSNSVEQSILNYYSSSVDRVCKCLHKRCIINSVISTMVWWLWIMSALYMQESLLLCLYLWKRHK